MTGNPFASLYPNLPPRKTIVLYNLHSAYQDTLRIGFYDQLFFKHQLYCKERWNIQSKPQP